MARPHKQPPELRHILICPVCGIEGQKDAEFTKGVCQGHPCRRCAAERNLKWRRDRPEMVQVWRRERYERNRELLRSIKRVRGCASCAEDDPICLDFHHRDPAEKSWSIAKRMAGSKKETLLAEVEKCIVLCRNCHAKLHWGNDDVGI